jgi:hypothetical protein
VEAELLHADGEMDGQTDGRTDGQMDGWTDRQTEGQIDRLTRKDVTNVIVAFRNFENSPKNKFICLCSTHG